MKKRIIPLLLALCMVFALLPVTAMADSVNPLSYLLGHKSEVKLTNETANNAGVTAAVREVLQSVLEEGEEVSVQITNTVKATTEQEGSVDTQVTFKLKDGTTSFIPATFTISRVEEAQTPEDSGTLTNSQIEDILQYLSDHQDEIEMVNADLDLRVRDKVLLEKIKEVLKPVLPEDADVGFQIDVLGTMDAKGSSNGSVKATVYLGPAGTAFPTWPRTTINVVVTLGEPEPEPEPKPDYADSDTLYAALEYLRIHKDEVKVSNDIDEAGLAAAVLEVLKPMIPEGMEITATTQIYWEEGFKATTEKDGNLVAHIILHSGPNQNDWTVQFTIPKVAVNLSDVEKLEEDAKAITAAWADYFAGEIITKDNISRRSGPLLDAAKAAVKNGSELKWMLGDKLFSTNFEEHYIRGTLQMTLNGQKKELELDITINSDGSTTMNKPSTGTTPAEPEKPTEPEKPSTSGDIAYPSTQIVDLNGTEVEFQMYALKDANGNDTNHIKIRDLALALNGTSATFNIGWANGVSAITTGAAYEPNGTENKTPFSGQRPYTKSATSFILNGTAIDLEGIVLTDDSGGGYTYCQVKDLAAKLNFTARWDAARQIICIETE